MEESIRNWLEERKAEFGQIEEDRKKLLMSMGGSFYEKLKKQERINLLFVCTHNSRRSQMAQALMQAASDYYHIVGIQPLSAGTKETAFHPYAIKALRSSGFLIKQVEAGSNPVYEVKLNANTAVGDMFSKALDHISVPVKDFVAVMVCDQADAECPFVPGADSRFSVHYEDPGKNDRHPDPLGFYKQTLRNIGREMMFLASSIRNHKS